MSSPIPEAQKIVVIEPSEGWRAVDLREIWRFRELLYFLVWRDVKVRYKQTILGITWAVIQPLFAMIVFTVIFGRVARLPSDGIPYSIFAYAGLLPWTLFAGAVNAASGSLLGSSNLITKVYFPRLLIPIAAVATVLVDFLLALMFLGPLMLSQRVVPAVQALFWVPVSIAACLLLAIGLGIWFSALVVRFRDLRHAIPFVVQVWMYATPIVYPLSMIPERYRWVMNLNPMASIVETFRRGLLGRPVDASGLGLAILIAAVVVITGGRFFRKLERVFADII